MQQLVHFLGPSFAPAIPHRGLVVLAPAPGEQHTLGQCLAREFLRRSGWGVQPFTVMEEIELLDLVATEWVDMLGFTISNERLREPLAALIAAVRKLSRNRDLPILVGGAIDLRDFAAQHDVTLVAADPRDAVRYLELELRVRGSDG